MRECRSITYVDLFFCTLTSLVLSMTTLEHTPHVIRRRGWAPHYTPANVAKFQPEMHESMCEVLNVNIFFHFYILGEK